MTRPSLVFYDTDTIRKLAWSAENGEEHIDLFLVMGTPHGELYITLADGRVWSTQVEVLEIAIFMSGREDLLQIYLDEMVLNAKAHR